MEPTAFMPALRGVLISAIVVLVGVPPTLRVAVYPLASVHGLSTVRADRTAFALVCASLLAIVVSVTGLTYLQAPGAIPASVATVGRFFGTERGIAWLAEATVVPIVGAVTVLSFPRRSRVSRCGWLAAVTLGGLVVLAVVSWQGHSTAIESETIAIAVKFVHMTGAALWMGGLVVLAVIAPRVFAEATEETDKATEVMDPDGASENDGITGVDGTAKATAVAVGMIRRFSIVAVAGVVLAVASGLVITAWHIKSVASLTSTLYGMGLVAKVVLVLVAAGLGGFNRAIVVRCITRGSDADRGRFAQAVWDLPFFKSHDPIRDDVVSVFVRAVRLELAVLLGVIFLSVFLTATLSPPVDPDDQSVGIEAPMGVGDGAIDAWLAQHGGSFTFLIELAALGIAFAGIIAVGYELVRWRSRESTE